MLLALVISSRTFLKDMSFDWLGKYRGAVSRTVSLSTPFTDPGASENFGMAASLFRSAGDSADGLHLLSKS